MAAHPIFVDPRAVEDFWTDVKAWLRRHDRSSAWLAQRLGLDTGALCRMQGLEQHTPVDVYWAVVRELGPSVGRAPAERAGVELVPVAWSSPTRRVEDARSALVTTGSAVGRLAVAVADNELDEAELEALRPDLEAVIEVAQRLLRRRGPVALGGAS